MNIRIGLPITVAGIIVALVFFRTWTPGLATGAVTAAVGLYVAQRPLRGS